MGKETKMLPVSVIIIVSVLSLEVILPCDTAQVKVHSENRHDKHDQEKRHGKVHSVNRHDKVDREKRQSMDEMENSPCKDDLVNSHVKYYKANKR